MFWSFRKQFQVERSSAMFERYTEKSRRVIFFARYEASQFGSPYIETEHLLLGLLREDKALTQRFFPGQHVAEEIRKQIDHATVKREKVSTSVDLPLSNEGKRVLAYTAEETERLGQKLIGTEHLLLGLLREEKSFAAELLHERGLRLSAVRDELARQSMEPEGVPPRKELGILSNFSANITNMAHEGSLPPLVGREKELAQVMQVLGRSSKNNVVLVGATGVGKAAIVNGLAHQIADGTAPEFLSHMMLAEIDLAMVVTAAQHSAKSKEFLDAISAELARWSATTIYFFDELHALLAAGAPEITLLLKPALLSGAVRCIATATPEDYRAALKKASWLERCFLALEIQQPTEAEAIQVLAGTKARFEKFHSVEYSEEAVRAAVIYSRRCLKSGSLPEKALDLLDDAGAYVKMKYEGKLPEEIREAMKRIKFITRRTENAVANHEFEKARFYSDEERREREAFEELKKKHNLEKQHMHVVTEEHVAEALARWTGMTVAAVRAMPEPEPDEAALPKRQSRKKKQ
jgi:ATP-dependent Clp protease ATP-binding subunit ClpC